MDTTAFKLRMLNLKSYRENNPGKGYWDWRNSLPDNLKNTDDSEYDMRTAYLSGAQLRWNEEDKSYHLPTRDPQSGLILKKSIHPTFWKGLTEDAKLGYNAYFLNDKTYTKSKGEGPINAFLDGGLNDNKLLPIRGTTTTNSYGDKTHYVAASLDGDTLNLNLPDVVITPSNNLGLAGSVSKAMNNVARAGVNAATYVTPLGDVEDVYNIGKDISSGNYGLAALGAGLMLLPNFIAKPIKRVAKFVKGKKATKAAEVVEDVVRGSNKADNTVVTTSKTSGNSNQPIEIPDDFDRYSTEDLARRRGLFDQRFDDSIAEIRNGIQANEDLMTEYQRLLNSPSATVDEANALRDRIVLGRKVLRNRVFDESSEYTQLYNQYNELYNNLPRLSEIFTARDNIRDRGTLAQMQSTLDQVTQLRDNLWTLSQQDATPELYELLLNLRNNMPSHYQIIYNRANDAAARRLDTLIGSIQDEIDAALSMLKPGNTTNRPYQTSLIREEVYDKAHLPAEFTSAEVAPGDIRNASYFYDNAKKAVDKATYDFNNLMHGQAWNLTSNRAVSTDSYPLQLNLMSKYKDDGFIKVFRDGLGNIQTMKLNHLGRLDGDKAVSRINKKLQKISEITGEPDLKATVNASGEILVPKISYRKYQDGGKTGDSDMEKFYQATGRSRSGRPLEEGLKPAVNLRDIMDFTPVGDALAAKDTYDAVKNKDWLGAGISAVAMLPFVPTVNKRLVSDAIDRMTAKVNKEAKMATRLNNETYELVQRLTDDPGYMRRAQEVKNKFGDDYTQIYADLINAYNTNPLLLPKAKATEFTNNARAKMATTIESTERHKAGGEFPKLGEYEYQFDSSRGVPYGVSVHENNHLTDFLSNKTPDAGGNSNMYYYMRSALKPYSDNLSRYYGNPSEQKAYMNLLREFMYANKMIDTRDLKVSRELIEEALNKLPKGMKSVKDASKSWKSMRSYTKWFNTIPLLGVGLVGANNYFNNTEE